MIIGCMELFFFIHLLKITFVWQFSANTDETPDRVLTVHRQGFKSIGLKIQNYETNRQRT